MKIREILETINKNNDLISLRFPVLKYAYEDGRNV